MTFRFSVLLTFVLGVSALASGCSGGKGTSPQTPLTDDQKATLKATIDNVHMASTAAVASSQKEVAVAADDIQGSPVSTQQQQMTSALNQSSCTFQPTPVDQNNPKPTGYDFRVSGSNCPISLDFGMWLMIDGTKTTMQFVMEYSVLADAFKMLNDVDSVSIHGPMTNDSSDNGFSANLSGTIHSQKYGPITYSMIGQNNGDQAGIEIKYVFPIFTADIIATGDLAGKNISYSINGQSTTAYEFYSYWVIGSESN